MITKISIIGTMDSGETRTASIAVKGRRFDNKAVKRLLEKDERYIETMMNQFISLDVCLELRKSQWSKPLKAKLMVEDTDTIDEKLEIISTMLMIIDYEMAVGKFRDCSF